MVKILKVGFSSNKGGIETVGLVVQENIDTSKFKIDYLSFSPIVAFEEQLNKAGSKIFHIPKRSQNYVKHYIELIKFFLRDGRKYDVVHYSASDLYTISPLMLAWLFGIKIRILHARNASLNTSKKRLILKHGINKSIAALISNRFITVSDEAAKLMFTRGNFIDRKYEIMKNPVNIDRFIYSYEKRNEIRKKYCLESKNVILHVATFLPVKNHIMSVEIIKQLSRIDDNAYIIFVGDGPLKNQISEQLIEYGLGERCLFVGMVDNVEDFYSASDVLILPSLNEGLGNVVLEAQVSGLKCVVSTQVPSVVDINDNVDFVDLSDLKSWCAKVVQGFSNSREIANTSNIFDKYKIEEIALTYQKMYLGEKIG